MSETEFDYVLYDRARRGPVYHRPVYRRQGFAGVKPACGSRTRFQFDQVDEAVAIDRYKAWHCGACWRGGEA